MTYVEFFDKIASENISACLTNAPDRVILIGDNAKKMKKSIANYEKVFIERGLNIEFLFKTISKSNLDNAVDVLTDIVEKYNDCVFDITGGEEILMLALGIVYANHPEKNIQIHKINLRNNAIYDCDKDGSTIFEHTPKLSIDENIRIYGGEVVYGNIDEEKTYKWDLNKDFVNDINIIWNICKGNVRYWNTIIGIFEIIEIVGFVQNDNPLTTVCKRSSFDTYMEQHKLKSKMSKGILNYLTKHKLLTYVDAEETITVTYKNEQVKKCLTKAGQALEMKIFVTAQGVADKENNKIYNDAANGVVIDWDGEFHDEAVEKEYDTENEIDILLMHGIVPVFISCKNGIVTAEELYKLNTVAERFGGHYSKKVLAATSLSDFGEAGKYLRQRAKDMNITVLDDKLILDDAELERRLKTLWCN